jgi:glycine cleavage system aminomethyltransferase T
MVTGFSRFRRVGSRWRSDDDVAGAVPGNAAVAAPAKRDRAARWKSDFAYVAPTLKKRIALASVGREHAAAGILLQMGMTVQALRPTVAAKVLPLPFFNPPHKTATPVA